MKLRIEAEAEREAEDAARWYEARRRGLGVEFLAAVIRASGESSRIQSAFLALKTWRGNTQFTVSI